MLRIRIVIASTSLYTIAVISAFSSFGCEKQTASSEGTTSATQYHYDKNTGLGRNYLGGGAFLGVSPHFNIDTTDVVFAGLSGGSSQIFSYNIRLHSLRQITHTQWWNIDPVFLRSGKAIAFVSDQDASDGEFYVIASDDGGPSRRIAPSLTFRHDPYAISQCGPQPAPLADSFAFAAWDKGGHQGVFLYDNAKNSMRRISTADRDAGRRMWSATGTYLYFSTSRTSDPRIPWDVVRVTMSSGRIETLLSGRKLTVLGTTLNERSVIALQDNGSGWELCVAAAVDHWQLHSIESVSGDATWSAQANTAVFVTDSERSPYLYDLWKVDINGAEQQLTTFGGYLMEPGFSWDGREILVDVDEAGAPQRGFGQIYRVGTIGKDLQMLCETKH